MKNLSLDISEYSIYNFYMDKIILKLYVNITGFHKVESEKGCAQMLLFDGEAKGEIFNGTVKSGGVDTQKYTPDNKMSLSARYVLTGTDDKGQSCDIFVENNALANIGEELITKPWFITNSKSLKWIETADISGHIENENGQTVIVFTYSN